MSEWVAQGMLEHHPAPLLFVALLFMHGLAYIAAVAPARARHELAPLRAGVWIGDHLTGVGTGPLACAFAGWLAALLELVPAMSDERRIIHSAWLSLSVGSLFVNFLRVARLHPGPVQSSEHPGDATCGVCRACKPPRAHHCAECNRCALRMDHHCSWTGNCVGLRELLRASFTCSSTLSLRPGATGHLLQDSQHCGRVKCTDLANSSPHVLGR